MDNMNNPEIKMGNYFDFIGGSREFVLNFSLLNIRIGFIFPNA